MARILIVDDDEAMRITVEASLDGYDVQLAGSGAEALQHMSKADFEVVLCDLTNARNDRARTLRVLGRRISPAEPLCISCREAGCPLAWSPLSRSHSLKCSTNRSLLPNCVRL